MMKPKTSTYYVQKAVAVKAFHIIKAHIIDDDCNEYTATMKGDWIGRGYFSAKEIRSILLDLVPYSRDEWIELSNEMEYPVHIERVG